MGSRGLVEIYPLKFSKQDFRAAPASEQLFHMLLAQRTNGISILRKQVHLPSINPPVTLPSEMQLPR